MYALRLLIASVTLVTASFTAPKPPPPEPVSQTNEIPTMVAAVDSEPRLFPPPPTTTTLPPTTTTTAPLPPPTTTTTEPPAPPVAAPTSAGECGGLVPLIAKYWPAEQVSKVCQVIGCETGYTYSATAENPGSTASGLLQFLDGTWRDASQYVAGAGQYARASHAPAEVQIAVGAAWWARTSWSQWQCA